MLLEQVAQAEVIYGSADREILDRARNLKWLQGAAAGVESLAELMKDHPAALTNFAATFAPAISETAVGMLACLSARHQPLVRAPVPRAPVEAHGQHQSDHHVEISGRTMGIVGFGGIGQAVARRAHYGFDMKILAVDPKPLHKPPFVAELRDPGWLMEMVPQVDVLVAAAPHTPLTDRMFNEPVFRAMKKTAYFLALSRGKLIDDTALALKEGWIAGAGLDEPPPLTTPSSTAPASS